MAKAHTYYAQTMPGVERIAWLEIRQRFPRAGLVEYLFAKDQNGIVLFECAADPARLLDLRTTEDVFCPVVSLDGLSRDWGDLRRAAAAIEESPDLDRAARVRTRIAGEGRSARVTYRVIARKVGRHRYRRIDLEQAIAKGLERRYGPAWTPVEDDATVEVWANVLGSRLLCGVRLSDRSMRHRAYKVATRPASLRPSVAAAMVLLTDPAPDDVFVDSMCGCGTLLAERALAGPYRRIIGGDLLPDRVLASRRNMEAAGARCTLGAWDAGRLPLPPASIDKAAINLPFGKQVGSRAQVEALYPRVLAELARVLAPGARAAVLSSEYELVKEVVRGQPGLHVVTGYSVAVLGQWARIYVLERE
jgi:23S rRNA G2445 N2-methylase RlmL